MTTTNKLTNDETKLIRDAIWFYHDQLVCKRIEQDDVAPSWEHDRFLIHKIDTKMLSIMNEEKS
tara:strand:- start:793 stop:984 length:192 start_codon:yes stop_codon:yes gene_type:complete